MRYYIIILIFIVSLFAGCNSNKYTVVKHVKPVNYNRSYNRKKDKRKKRVKYVRVKILKKSAEVKPAKEKSVKKKKSVKSDSLATDELAAPVNETDSTGSF
ncbi:hypothetical protein [Fulvivirga lutea]|uniref:Lipoprotein n=1 Tax=Fulvivirga lutea TaxID=2810512 RepID=A0A974WGB0_9BACT|nr:hypothetical protein [Fulvivirga lutea]QSE96527.1 hypothetical protein JR347_13075 [Fulvivirga lutea]